MKEMEVFKYKLKLQKLNLLLVSKEVKNSSKKIPLKKSVIQLLCQKNNDKNFKLLKCQICRLMKNLFLSLSQMNPRFQLVDLKNYQHLQVQMVRNQMAVKKQTTNIKK